MNAAAARMASHDLPFATVFTLVLWLVTAGVSVVGVVVPYARPMVPAKMEIPIEAQSLNVELTSDPLPSPDVSLPPRVEPPPLDSVVTPPSEAPALTPVAEPSVVAFALPVEGSVLGVDPKRAAYVAPAVPAEAAPVFAPTPPVEQITYGQGEGRQPAPEYPYRAQREGQEGVVKVRFAVGENGRVLSAEAAIASPWPMLNQAAVRVVRDRWQFRQGTLRLYEVSIRFQLTR